jgi:hypothetical protein
VVPMVFELRAAGRVTMSSMPSPVCFIPAVHTATEYPVFALESQSRLFLSRRHGSPARDAPPQGARAQHPGRCGLDRRQPDGRR